PGQHRHCAHRKVPAGRLHNPFRLFRHDGGEPACLPRGGIRRAEGLRRAYAKQHPGMVTFASSGGLQQLGGELFKLAAGVNMTHVPYKGAGPAVLDLLGGNVNTMISNPTSIVPHVKAGKLRALGVMGATRIDALRDVPTAVEMGFKEFGNVVEWYGMVAPAGTPRPIVRRLNEALVGILGMPDVQERIRTLGMTP